MEEQSKKNRSDHRNHDLPESVIHHILSFLDMKEVVQKCSLVAKSWRYLWISIPVLNFNHTSWNKFKSTKRNQEKFVTFVDQVFLLRDNSSIRKLHLCTGDFCDAWRIHTWVTAAVRRQVEEIYLQIYPSVSLQICSLVTMCSSVHLKTLQLRSVTLPGGGGGLNGELKLNCPVLETLNMIKCNYHLIKMLHISAPRLINLVLENDVLSHNASCKLKICTPNLKAFKCGGCTYKDFALEKLAVLMNADIDLDTYIGNAANKMELIAGVVNVLKGIYNVSFLTLSASSLQVLAEYPHTLDYSPDQFPALRHLKLTKLLTRACAPAILKLFDYFTRSLETLVLEITEVQDWRPEYLSWCTIGHGRWLHFHRLKSIQIRHLKGSEAELKLLEVLLKKAYKLENIIIITTKTKSRGEEKKLVELSKNLLKLPEPWLRVSILFILRSGT